MTPRIFRMLFLPGLCSAVVSAQSAVAVSVADSSPRYVVAELGVSSPSDPTGISNAGHVTGLYFNASGVRRAFLWDHGVVSDLGTLGGIAQTFAVNDAATAVGYSVNAQGEQRAIAVQNGVITDLGTLHQGNFAAAHDINNAGWVAGMSERRIGNDRVQRAALWSNGTVIDLGTFGGEYSEAHAINEAGQVVGWAWYPPPTRLQRAFLWSASTGMIDLATLGGSSSTASDVNDHGAVVGSASTAPNGDVHAFLWAPQTGMIDLGVPAGANQSHATAINNAGQIVGNSFLPAECRTEPLLWQNGVLQRLNELIDLASGWTIVQANDIDDEGHIAASALRAGSYRAVLLVPTGQ